MIAFNLVYRSFPEVLHGAAHAFTVVDAKGHCVIFVDQDLDELTKHHAIKHELSHIVLGHFEDDRTKDNRTYLDNIDEIEREANDYADQMSEEVFADLMTYQILETVSV